jgi:auxin efflux carrier (AEC)
MIFVNSLESVLSIIIMIALGYILTWKGLFSEVTAQAFATVVTKVALPAYMVWNMTSVFDRDKLFSLADGLIIPFLSMFLCYGIGYIVAKGIKVVPKRQGAFQCMFFISNTIFIGLPVNMALFGESSVPYVLLYYIANTSLFWTLGVYVLSGDGDGKQAKLLSFQALQKMFSPPLMGFVVGIFLVVLDIKLPAFIMDSCKYLGNLTTPLSLLFIGISMYGANLADFKISKDLIAVVLGRFVVSPALIFLIAYFLPISKLMKEVFIIQAAMPVMTQVSIIAKNYHADYRYVAVMTTITTILAMVAIPIYMFLFHYLG